MSCAQGIHRLGTDTNTSRISPAEETPEKKIADSLWLLRIDPLQAKKALFAYVKANKKQKHQPLLLARLSHAYYFVANYIETNPQKKDALFRSGWEAAQKALEKSPGYRRIFKISQDELEAGLGVEKEYIDAIFWFTANLGKSIVNKPISVRRGNQEMLEAYNKKILSFDENFFYAAPHRFLGVFNIKAYGGDLLTAKNQFEIAVKIAPHYLGNRTLYAEYYAVKANDKDLFLKQLNLVINTPIDSSLEIAPENHYELLLAKALLQNTDRLFEKP